MKEENHVLRIIPSKVISTLIEVFMEEWDGLGEEGEKEGVYMCWRVMKIICRWVSMIAGTVEIRASKSK